jgi:hypothetical protein
VVHHGVAVGAVAMALRHLGEIEMEYALAQGGCGLYF